MPTRFCLTAALLVATTAWSQVPTSEPATNPGSSGQMLTPPPVNSAGYSTTLGADTRSNYLRAGLVFATEYSDNVLSNSDNPVSDVDYSVYPMIALDKRTSRMIFVGSYSPGFTTYQRTSRLNLIGQNVGLDFQYRLSPHLALTLTDYFRETSNVLGALPLSEGAVSGAPPLPINAVIGAVGTLLSNNASAELTYQFTRNGMVGATGTAGTLHYLNPNQVIGLYDSSGRGGSAFYSHRVSKRHYIGVSYQYQETLAFPRNAQSEVESHTIFVFYTLYLKPGLSISFSGGPQHYDISQPPLPVHGSWSPTSTASIAWQGLHTAVAVSYTHVVTGGGGLVGAFQTESATSIARWRFSRTWNAGVAASYANNKSISPASFLTTEGGHSIFATVSAQHELGEHLQMEFGYTRLHENYGFVPSISTAPNTDRLFVSFAYHFARPLGG